jgi:hypothetical protein
MPKTVDSIHAPGYREGAHERSRHRVLMAMRWRNKELWAEDKKKRRLPSDWHDWMLCPAADGYKSWGCTCHQAIDNAPRSMVERERQLRAMLDRELSIPIKERLKAANAKAPRVAPVVAIEPAAVSWVKSIDTSVGGGSMPPHARVDGLDAEPVDRGSGRVGVPPARGRIQVGCRLADAQGAVAVDVAPKPLRAPAAESHPRASGREGRSRLRSGYRTRFSAWIGWIRDRLSDLHGHGRAAG